MWLKRSTAQNIVIGGAAGALPADDRRGRRHRHGRRSRRFVLFPIIFVWTPPHFWALALVKSGDYARAGIPMMPNVAGPDATRRQILALHARPRAARRRARRRSASAASPTRVVSRHRRRSACWRSRSRSSAAARASGDARGAAALRASRSSTSSSLFATLLAEHGLGLMRPIPGWSAMTERRPRRPPSPEEHEAPARALGRHRAGARRARASCSTCVTIAKLGPQILNRPL